MRLTWFCMLLICMHQSLAQIILLESSAHLHLDEQTTLYAEGEVFLSGTLDNQGEIAFEQHVDFGSNKELGTINFTGSENQTVSGDSLNVQKWRMNNSGRVDVFSPSVSISGELDLESGVITTQFTRFIVSGIIKGGSHLSFVDGALSVNTRTGEETLFPMGYQGEYLPLTIANAGESILTISLNPAEDHDQIVPSDSLVGVTNDVIWTISQSKGAPIKSKVSLSYSNFDFMDLSGESEIKAESYSPVIVKRQSDSSYVSLGIGEGSDLDQLSSGTLFSLQEFFISSDTVQFAVGVLPRVSGLKLFVPTAFTPGSSDEANNLFRPFINELDIRSLDLKVWDSNNAKVFDKFWLDSPLNETGWNGQSNGRDVSQGIYYYQFKLIAGNGQAFNQSGTVMLIR